MPESVFKRSRATIKKESFERKKNFGALLRPSLFARWLKFHILQTGYIDVCQRMIESVSCGKKTKMNKKFACCCFLYVWLGCRCWLRSTTKKLYVVLSRRQLLCGHSHHFRSRSSGRIKTCSPFVGPKCLAHPRKIYTHALDSYHSFVGTNHLSKILQINETNKSAEYERVRPAWETSSLRRLLWAIHPFFPILWFQK